MNLPRVSYISPGPAAPERSLDTAAAPAKAMAQIGSEIFQAGQKGFQIAEKVRETNEAGIRAKFLADQQAEDAEFSSSLLYRSDFQNFGKEYQARANERRNKAAELGLSPAGRTVLDQQLLDYTTRQSIQIETQAALRMHREGTARVGIGLAQSARMGDQDGIDRNLAELRRMGATESEVEEARMKAEDEARDADIQRDINDNPAAAKEIVRDPEFRKNTPPSQVAKYDGMLREKERVIAFETTETFLNGVLDGSIKTPKDIDERFPDASARLKMQMRDTLAQEITDRDRAYRQTPAYQDAVAGDVSAMLDNYNVEMEGFDEQFFIIDQKIRTLPEGAMKARLNWRLDNVRKGQVEEWTTATDEYRDRLKQNFHGGGFGDFTSKTSVQDFLNAGILKDRQKLVAEGFSEDQAEEISKVEDPWKQLEKYREFHKDKAGYSYSEPYDLAAFELLAKPDQRGFAEYPDEAKKVAATRAYGEAMRKFENFARAHPKATPEQLEKEYYKVVKPSGAQRVRDALIPAPPVFVPPQDPDKLPTDRGAASGSLLPPRDAE